MGYLKGGVGHTGRIGRNIGKGNPLTGFLNIAQIDLYAHIAGIHLVQVFPGANQIHGNGFRGNLRVHQIFFVQHGFTFPHHRDVVEGDVVFHADVVDHIPPQAKSNHNRKQTVDNFIFH